MAWTGNTYPDNWVARKRSFLGCCRASHNQIRPNLLNEVAYNHNGNNITIANTGLWKAPSDFSTTPIFHSPTPSARSQEWKSVAHTMVNMDIGNWPWSNTWRSNQWKNDLSWTHGAHNYKFGFAWMHTHKNQQIFDKHSWNLQIQWDSDWMCPSELRAAPSPASDLRISCLAMPATLARRRRRIPSHIAFNTMYLYAMDDWRVSKRLTLNLGVRWEGLPHAYDTHNRASNFYPNLYNPADAAEFTSPTSGALNTSGPGFTTVSGVKLSNVPFYMNGVGLAGRNGISPGLVQNHWRISPPASDLHTIYMELGKRFCAADSEFSSNAMPATKSTTWAQTCRSATAPQQFIPI